MSGGSLLLAGLGAIFVAIAGSASLVGRLALERHQAARSLTVVRGLSSRTTGARAPVPIPFLDRVLTPAYGRLARFARRLSPGGVSDKLGRRLDLAGNPVRWTVERILALKALGLFGFTAVGLLAGHSAVQNAVLFAVVGGAFGFFLPDLLLSNAGSKRQKLIQYALPDALDMLTIGVEAGLSFDAGLANVARNTPGPLSAEFFRALQEMQIGKGRAAALIGMGERSTVPELRVFVAAVVQAGEYGVPISKVLREQAREMRRKRHQRAEEQAQKVPVKILFPLIFFIMPSVFIVIVGPGILTLMKAFSS